MCSWQTVQSLISQLATSLEYLELQRCEFLPPSQLQLPSFPCLQELRHHQGYIRTTFPDQNHLNELLRLGSRVTHLHVTGHFRNEPVTACPTSLQYLVTSSWMLSEHVFGTEPFPRLVHLTVVGFEYADIADPSSFISDHFPRITSLDLSTLWRLRDRAMVMARSQHNVQALKLVIYTQDWIMDEEVVPKDQLHHAMLPAGLQTLKLEVFQSHYELERGATRCSRWIFDHVIPSMTHLGGFALKSISLSVSQPKSRSGERERVLSRQWDKALNGDWQRLE